MDDVEYIKTNWHKLSPESQELARAIGIHTDKENGGISKMATMREEAKAYEPPQTLNIADLDKIPIELELYDGEGKDKEGEVFKYKFAKIDGKEYRVAGSILGGIKAILEKIPNLEFVQVIKQGQGMNTRYTVIPYTEVKEEKV